MGYTAVLSFACSWLAYTIKNLYCNLAQLLHHFLPSRSLVRHAPYLAVTLYCPSRSLFCRHASRTIIRHALLRMRERMAFERKNRFGKAFVHITRTAAQRPCLFYPIGERERANLVVQLARYFYFPILRFYGTLLP